MGRNSGGGDHDAGRGNLARSAQDGAISGASVRIIEPRLLLRGLTRRHAAIQYAVPNPQSGVMEISSAGMPGPVHLSRRDCSALTLTGIPPGLSAESCYGTSTLKLEPGDTVLFFSDGVGDAFNSVQEAFGMERLETLCEMHRNTASR